MENGSKAGCIVHNFLRLSSSSSFYYYHYYHHIYTILHRVMVVAVSVAMTTSRRELKLKLHNVCDKATEI